VDCFEDAPLRVAVVVDGACYHGRGTTRLGLVEVCSA